MKWIRNYKLFKESKKDNLYSTKNLVNEICVSMVLLNNEFLDSILDKGLKARYSEDSHIFLTDLKNLLIAKNRLQLGKFENGKCIEDTELSKVTGLFDGEFSIEKDWDKLSGARITARNIIDKLLVDEKLTPERIRTIFWLGPNKTDGYKEDIIIELNDGKQYSLFLNKNLSTQKSASFNTFADDLIGEDIDKLFNEEYINKWDKLTQEWVKLIYENANKDIQRHIEKFIDAKRIDTLTYFEYFDIRHQDPKYKHLGEFIKDFNKNILKFSDLMTEIWKTKDNSFMDTERVMKEWYETKIVILNSKILENLLTTSLKTNYADDIEKLDDNFKLAGGTVKMKLFKTLVEKLGCLERPTFFLGKNGSVFNVVPSREFFRKYYDNIDIKFDYHVNFAVSEEEENNDFRIKINLELDGDKLIDMVIHVKFTGSEMSGKLGAQYKFDLADNFNYLISKKELSEFKPSEDDEGEFEDENNIEMTKVKTFEGFLDLFKKKEKRKSITQILDEDLNTIKDAFQALEDEGYRVIIDWKYSKSLSFGQEIVVTIDGDMNKDILKDNFLFSIPYLKEELGLDFKMFILSIPNSHSLEHSPEFSELLNEYPLKHKLEFDNYPSDLYRLDDYKFNKMEIIFI